MWCNFPMEKLDTKAIIFNRYWSRFDIARCFQGAYIYKKGIGKQSYFLETWPTISLVNSLNWWRIGYHDILLVSVFTKKLILWNTQAKKYTYIKKNILIDIRLRENRKRKC